MKVSATPLPGVLVVAPDLFRDDRGFFLESYHRRRYAEHGMDAEFVQDNHARSRRGVLRGLHLQARHPQGKLVRVSQGRVWDVAADVDPASPTFRQSFAIELSGDNQLQLFIPPGYAHGYCVLSEMADFHYKCTDFYRPEDARGIAWNDPELAIEWPLSRPVLSPADAANPSLADFLAAS